MVQIEDSTLAIDENRLLVASALTDCYVATLDQIHDLAIVLRRLDDLTLVENVVLQGYHEIVDKLPIHIGKEMVEHRDKIPKEHIDELILHLG